MITDSYDNQTEPIVSLRSFYGEQKHLCDICIVIFSKVIYDHMLASFPCEQIAEIGACNGHIPIYAMTHRDRKIAFYLSGLGSTAAANDVIEANWLTGATRFIMFGSAGSLNQHATQGKYVIPTEAYRDEGMSYHYAEPADYIRITEADTVAAMFDDLKVPYVKGRVWTTDAMLRETRGLMNQRVNEGCIAVEMELAGVQAVCSFHGFRLYNFLVTGDVLDEPEYRCADLHNANHALDKFYLALEIALRL
ncbi:MAG: nucleoside phosphorylase [Christensenellaceae bacterium]|nr:nucleoside phosphorylase [Christensenellaceae bacterium]